MAIFKLPAGTVCKRSGIPFVLVKDTEIECQPENFSLIAGGFKPMVSYDGQTLDCSQSVHCLEKPIEAQPDLTNAVTSSSSLESKSALNKSLT